MRTKNEWKDLNREASCYSEAKERYGEVMENWENDLKKRMEIFLQPLKDRYPEIKCTVDVFEVIEMAVGTYYRCTHPILFQNFTTYDNKEGTHIRVEDLESIENGKGVLYLELDSMGRLLKKGIPVLGVYGRTKISHKRLPFYYGDLLLFLESGENK